MSFRIKPCWAPLGISLALAACSGAAVSEEGSNRPFARRFGAEAGFSEEGLAGPVAMPTGAKLDKDVAYGDDPAQRMDAYVPAHSGLVPVIFMVHGGAWMIGDKSYSNVVANKVARWLPQGVILISVNYRMLPKANPLEQARDVGRALSAAQARAEREWGGDPARFVLMGHSAGAHLVALIGADPSIALQQGAKPWLGTVSLDSASMDVVQTMEQPHYGFYDKVFGRDRNFWREASPLHRIQGTPAPFLMVCSSFRQDSCPQAQAFASKLQAAGGRVSVLPQPMKHGDINRKLGEPGAYTEAVEAFLRSLGLSLR